MNVTTIYCGNGEIRNVNKCSSLQDNTEQIYLLIKYKHTTKKYKMKTPCKCLKNSVDNLHDIINCMSF